MVSNSRSRSRSRRPRSRSRSPGGRDSRARSRTRSPSRRRAAAPAVGGFSDVRPGDWSCPSCNFNVFASRSACPKCATANPNASAVGAGPGVRPGDWRCPSCSANVFASKSSCFKCGARKPQEDSMPPLGAGGAYPQPGGSAAPDVRPGDWSCPTCNYTVFASKSMCFKCGTKKPSATPYSAPYRRSPPRDSYGGSNYSSQRSPPRGYGAGGPQEPPGDSYGSRGQHHRQSPPRDSYSERSYEPTRRSPPRESYGALGSSYGAGEYMPKRSPPRGSYRGGGGDYGRSPPRSAYGGYGTSQDLGGGYSGGGASAGADVRPGDWSCPTCNSNVFASRSACFKCQTPKPVARDNSYGAHEYSGGGGSGYHGSAVYESQRPYESQRNSSYGGGVETYSGARYDRGYY